MTRGPAASSRRRRRAAAIGGCGATGTGRRERLRAVSRACSGMPSTPNRDAAGAPHRQLSQRHSWGAAGELGHGCPPEGEEHRSVLSTPLMDTAKLEKPPSPGGRVIHLKIWVTLAITRDPFDRHGQLMTALRARRDDGMEGMEVAFSGREVVAESAGASAWAGCTHERRAASSLPPHC